MPKPRGKLFKSKTIFLLLLGLLVIIAGSYIINKKGIAFLFKPKASEAKITMKGELVLPTDKRCKKVTTAMTLDEEGVESLEESPVTKRQPKKDRYWLLVDNKEEIVCSNPKASVPDCLVLRYKMVGLGKYISRTLAKLLHKTISVTGYLSPNCDWFAVTSWAQPKPSPTPTPTPVPTAPTATP